MEIKTYYILNEVGDVVFVGTDLEEAYDRLDYLYIIDPEGEYDFKEKTSIA